MNEKKYEMREPKESLHWISFSSKKQLEVLKEIKDLLEGLKDQIAQKPSEKPQNEGFPF